MDWVTITGDALAPVTGIAAKPARKKEQFYSMHETIKMLTERHNELLHELITLRGEMAKVKSAYNAMCVELEELKRLLAEKAKLRLRSVPEGGTSTAVGSPKVKVKSKRPLHTRNS